MKSNSEILKEFDEIMPEIIDTSYSVGRSKLVAFITQALNERTEAIFQAIEDESWDEQDWCLHIKEDTFKSLKQQLMSEESETVNGAYYCTQHNSKNCPKCFEQY